MTDFSSIPIRRNDTRFDSSWWNSIRTALIESGTVPTIINYANDAAYVTAKGSAAAEGDFYYNTTVDNIKYYNGTDWYAIADTGSIQTLVSKVIDADNNTISNLAHGAEVDNPTSGVHGVTGSVVGTSDTQALTAKDIDGGTASDTSRITLPKNTTANLAGLTDKEGTIAYDTDKGTIVINDGSAWTQVSGEGGGGGYNYNDNSYDDDISGVSTTDATNLAISQETTTPLLGTGSLLIEKAASDESSEYVTIKTFAQEDGHDVAIFDYEFGYKVTANYADDDLEAYIYDNTNSIEVPGSRAGLKASSLSTYIKKSFQIPSNSASMDLRLEVASTNASAYSVIIDGYSQDKLYIGPASPAVIGAPVTDWEDFTPSFTGFTLGDGTLSNFQWRRVGDSLQMKGRIALGSTSAVTGAIRIAYPNGYTSPVVGGDTFVASPVWLYDIGTTTNRQLGRTVIEPTNLGVGTTTGAISSTSPFTWAAGDIIDIGIATIPIAGWSSGVAMSETTMNREISFVGYHSTTQSIPNASYTTLGVSGQITATKDTVNMFNAANGEITIPETGEYEAEILTNLGNSATGVRYYALQVDGTDYVLTGDANPSSGNLSEQSGSRKFQLDKGKVVKFTVFQNSGGALDYYTSVANSHYALTKVNVGSQTIAASEKVQAIYEDTSGQSIPDNAFTKITWDTMVLDTHGALSAGVFTAKKSGVLKIKANVSWDNAADINTTVLRVNNTTQSKTVVIFSANLSTQFAGTYMMGGSTDLAVNVGDQIKIEVYQDDTGADAALLENAAGYNSVSFIME